MPHKIGIKPLELPTRPGERPATGPEVPHQQLDQTSPAELQEELWRRMGTLEGVRTGPSGISLPETRALHLHPALARGPKEAFLIGQEFVHLHGAFDGSLHAALPADIAAQAIESGWAEHHPLVRSGKVPETLVMIYGPRDAAELETLWQLVGVSYAFARGEWV
ncbi:phospholipase [Streptomyces cyaneochromogenes]|uniref:Phospholipase n=1 Tax=Streptomyces cyaneochromogenes TaxID=2496836 RepID=A0A3S9M0X8_9ACTN|nr:luciferase family protein [Streptomyces cyaneochromogenes]AZQ32844.1 phospholipase [Streptomyces cyaneochromogenes]